jgi:hypothetical protein
VTTKSRLGRLAKVEARRKGQCAGPKSPYITLEMRRLLADRLRAPGDPPVDIDDCSPPADISEVLTSLMARFCPSTGSQILAEQPGVGLPSETQNPEPVLEPDKQRE